MNSGGEEVLHDFRLAVTFSTPNDDYKKNNHKTKACRRMKTLLFLVVLAPFAVYTEAKPQTVTVKGTTICNKKRLSGALVELMERDTLDPNDLLQSKSTSSEGEFLVTGSEDEFGSIEPYLRITHNCNVKKPGCKRVSEFVVPSSKIGGVYDMTYVTLDILSSVDKEKC